MDIIPKSIDELMLFKPYIIGGLRKLNVPEGDLEDRLQDLYVHVLSTKFFTLVQEKVDAGLMDARQFRAYLGTTIRNVLVNGFHKDKRNPSIKGISTTVSEDSHDGIDLDRLTLEEGDLSIPSDVLESDIIRFVANRKPGFLPVLILRLMGYKMADISRIIGKRKETIHYRIKSLHALVEEYLGAPAHHQDEDSQTLSVGPSYQVGGENPFKDPLYSGIFDSLKTMDAPVTIRELSIIVSRLRGQKKIETKLPSEEVAGRFIAYALEKKAVSEVGGSTKVDPENDRTATVPRIRYRVVSDQNPYKNWGGAHPIFETIKSRTYFGFEDLYQIVKNLIQEKKIRTRRSVESVCWGFIETARAYSVIERAEEPPVLPGD